MKLSAQLPSRAVGRSVPQLPIEANLDSYHSGSALVQFHAVMISPMWPLPVLGRAWSRSAFEAFFGAAALRWI
jgi:hypothetical protein